jgi:hypothetical protein
LSIDFKGCSDDEMFFSGWENFSLSHPKRLEQLEEAYDVTVESINDVWLSHNFKSFIKGHCDELSRKAQSKYILDNNVANALASHNINFNFFNIEGHEINFATFQPFKGQTEKLTFKFKEVGHVLTGEATTLYSAMVTIRNITTKEVSFVGAQFYVSEILINSLTLNSNLLEDLEMASLC